MEGWTRIRAKIGQYRNRCFPIQDFLSSASYTQSQTSLARPEFCFFVYDLNLWNVTLGQGQDKFLVIRNICAKLFDGNPSTIAQVAELQSQREYQKFVLIQ